LKEIVFIRLRKVIVKNLIKVEYTQNYQRITEEKCKAKGKCWEGMRKRGGKEMLVWDRKM